ncbi:uncharacterized protein LOC126758678 [Bactrocera neohumeralis]|uniref:uncharacterized protein LOC126758678 n=1 Tax=Bactrocera neohumeralis TaxID=98809 RepID=UPI00216591BE|nr:uncharacterized protein LOC126758678 [Bactrocera neohumeralis]
MDGKMDFEVPVLAGYLNVPMQSSFSLNRISKKKNCHRYCQLFNSSRHGIERLEICESKDDKNPKIVTLENCVKITQEPAPANLILVIKKTESLTLNALSEEDLKEWTNALQMVAFRNKNSLSIPQAAIEEDNDLYCSSFGDGLFFITLIPSETSIRCNFESKSYILHLTATELQLKCTEDLNEIRARWPYRFIRKYGYRDGKFTFEAGRKCCTGEGIFTLDHTNPQEIFRCMAAKMKSMKKLINCDNHNNDINDNHWTIAANMEAGSRSPLTPNNQQCISIESNSQNSVSYREFATSSDSLNSCFTNSNNNSISTLLHPVLKQIPSKPPRKIQSTFPTSGSSNKAQMLTANLNFQLNADKLCKYQNYEAVSITTSSDPNKTIGSTLVIKPNSPECVHKQCLTLLNNETLGAERNYESIETVTDAWKTLGIDEVQHKERVLGKHCDEDFKDPCWQRSVHTCNRSLKETFLPSKVSRVIDIDIGEGGGGSGISSNSRCVDDSYDRLDFMSPNNKTSSGYNTIISVISPIRKRCNSPSLSDYEFIGNPEIELSKKNDIDKTGNIRPFNSNLPICPTSIALKCNIVGENYFEPSVSQQVYQSANISPTHENYSGINYTIVSKPKRV